MKKRILALSLSAALLLALLCACGDSGDKNSADPTNNPGSTQTAEPTPEPTPETPVDLSTFVDSLGGKYELPMVMPMDEELTLARFPGLDGLELPQCYYYAPMMTGVSTAEFVLIQVGSDADMDTVKSALQARIDAQNSPEAMLYPHEQEDWANHARIETNGNYVLMVVNENCDAMVDDFKALFA